MLELKTTTTPDFGRAKTQKRELKRARDTQTMTGYSG